MTSRRRVLLLLALLVWAPTLLISAVLVPGLAISPSFADLGDVHREHSDKAAIAAALITLLVAIVAIVAIARAAKGNARATNVVLVLTLGLVAGIVATVLALGLTGARRT